MRRIAFLVMLVCIVFASAGVAFAADAMNLEQLRARMSEALGGHDVLAGVNTVHYQYDGKMFGLDGQFDQWVAADGRTAMHLNLGGLFEVRGVFVRDHGWFLDQNGKLSELGGDDLAQETTTAYDVSWSYLIDGRMPGAAHYDGVEEGTGLHILRCEPEGGVPATYYVDPATFLTVRSESPLGDRTQTVTFSDWKEFGGVMMPTRFVQSRGDPQYDASFVLKTADINATPPAGTFDKPAENASAVTFTDGAPVLDIPIEFNTVHIFVQATINGSEPLWFILDTGASVTVINTDVARELGLDLQGKLEGRGAGEGSVEVNLIPDVSVAMKGVELDGQTVAALPFADIEARMGRAIDGILGYDFISRFVVEIDYRAHTMSLYDRDAFDYKGEGVEVPIILDGSTPMVDASVTAPGREPVTARFLIDTGAGGTVHFAKPFATEHDLASSFPKSYVYTGGYGVGGETSSTVGRLASLDIGGVVFDAPVCAVAHDEGGALADPNTAGLIGGMILEHCTVYFDYDRKRMILEPNADFDKPFETEWSGLLWRTEGRSNFHTFTVMRVMDGSPAKDAGMRKDDVITSVGGMDAAELTSHKMWQMFKRAGTKVSVTFTRDGKSKNVSLKLKRRV